MVGIKILKLGDELDFGFIQIGRKINRNIIGEVIYFDEPDGINKFVIPKVRITSL